LSFPSFAQRPLPGTRPDVSCKRLKRGSRFVAPRIGSEPNTCWIWSAESACASCAQASRTSLDPADAVRRRSCLVRPQLEYSRRFDRLARHGPVSSRRESVPNQTLAGSGPPRARARVAPRRAGVTVCASTVRAEPRTNDVSRFPCPFPLLLSDHSLELDHRLLPRSSPKEPPFSSRASTKVDVLRSSTTPEKTFKFVRQRSAQNRGRTTFPDSLVLSLFCSATTPWIPRSSPKEPPFSSRASTKVDVLRSSTTPEKTR
jgi:hypothetical protein